MRSVLDEVNLKPGELHELRSKARALYGSFTDRALSWVPREMNTEADLLAGAALPVRDWLAEAGLEQTAERVAGRKVAVIAIQADSGAATSGASEPASKPAEQGPRRDLRAEAMASSAVQAMLDVFPAEIRDVEEM